MTKSATFCDRCEAILWIAPTLKIQNQPSIMARKVADRGAIAVDPYGSQVWELCEACAVKLRSWVEKGEA